MNELIQHLVNALILGGTYALLGIGLTLIFGIMNVVNFTHGALYTVGAYVMYLAVAALGLNFFLALRWRSSGGSCSGPRSSWCCCARSGARTSTPPCW